MHQHMSPAAEASFWLAWIPIEAALHWLVSKFMELKDEHHNRERWPQTMSTVVSPFPSHRSPVNGHPRSGARTKRQRVYARRDCGFRPLGDIQSEADVG